MAFNLIETLNTSIYSPQQHTKHTKHISFSPKQKTQIHVFQKTTTTTTKFNKLGFMVVFWHYFYFMLRATQPT